MIVADSRLKTSVFQGVDYTSNPDNWFREGVCLIRALVVGGSSGIGGEISRTLAGAGHHVLVHGRNRDHIDALCREISENGGKAEPCLHAVSDAEEAARFFSAYLPVDILVVAFGPFEKGPLSDFPVDAWTRMVGMNLTLPGMLVSMVLPHMIHSGYGRIILFGGTGSDMIRGYAQTAAYAAAKAGLSVLVKSVARQTAGTGVTAALLCPGITRTDLTPDSEAEYWGKKWPEFEFINIKNYSRMVMEIVSGSGNALNGAIVSLDGGYIP